MKSLAKLVYSNFRLFLLKVRKGSRFHYHPHCYYLGSIEIEKKSHITLGTKACLSENSYVGAIRGGNIKIGDVFYCGRNCVICSMNQIEFGNNVGLGPNVCIYDHDHDYRKNYANFNTSPVHIGSNVWIGAGAIILRGTIIGDGSVVEAGAVVKGVFPPNSLILASLATSNRLIERPSTASSDH
jgi:acetyltransferase-like isoleucine patch superfamily enzyme